MATMKPFTFEWWMKIYDRAVTGMHDAQSVYDNHPLYEKNKERVQWIRERMLKRFGSTKN